MYGSRIPLHEDDLFFGTDDTLCDDDLRTDTLRDDDLRVDTLRDDDLRTDDTLCDVDFDFDFDFGFDLNGIMTSGSSVVVDGVPK